jgi:5'-nucleotidase
VRILVTNDDGVGSPGLAALARALRDAGHDVVVVAPDRDYSGSGAGVGPLHLTGAIGYQPVGLDGDIPASAVDGPPALCVLAACLGGFGPPPELVASGINAGANTGRAVLFSGTVGAALAANNLRRPGLAVSQAFADVHEWGSAAALAVALVPYAAGLGRRAVLNLNVPNVALDALRGVVPAPLDPGGTVQAVVVEREAGVLELRYPERPGLTEGTDTALVAAGYATLSVVVGPHAARFDTNEPGVPVNEMCERAWRAVRPSPDRRSA